MTDHELITALIRGENGAAEEILRRYKRLIYYILRVEFRFSQEDADDLFQIVWLALLADGCRRLTAWRGEGDFAPYLTTIVRNLALNAIRGRRRNPPPDDPLPDDDFPDEPQIADMAQNPADLAWLAEVRQILQHCYERLTPRERDLIRLRHWEGLSQQELADRLGITPTNAGVALMRAERKLRDCLSNRMGNRPWILR